MSFAFSEKFDLKKLIGAASIVSCAYIILYFFFNLVQNLSLIKRIKTFNKSKEFNLFRKQFKIYTP